MTDIMIGDLVVINLPLNRVGKRETIHGKAGKVLGVSKHTVPKKKKTLKYKIQILQENTQIYVCGPELLVKAAPENYPELFI